MPNNYLSFKCVYCGTYRGIDLFDVELAGIKNYSIRLGMMIFSNKSLTVLKTKIDEWYLLKRN